MKSSKDTDSEREPEDCYFQSTTDVLFDKLNMYDCLNKLRTKGYSCQKCGLEVINSVVIS